MVSVPLVSKSPVMLAVPARSGGSTSAPLRTTTWAASSGRSGAPPRSRASHFPVSFPLAWRISFRGSRKAPAACRRHRSRRLIGQSLGRGQAPPSLPSRAAEGRRGRSQSHRDFPPGENCRLRSEIPRRLRGSGWQVFFRNFVRDSLGFLHLLCRPRRFHRFRQILDHDFLFARRCSDSTASLHLFGGHRLEFGQVGIDAIRSHRKARPLRRARSPCRCSSRARSNFPVRKRFFAFSSSALRHAVLQNLVELLVERLLRLSDGFSAGQNHRAR